MATNPYSYGSLGQRWTVGEPTSKSLLDVSRVKADANRWALEQLIVDPDDTTNFVLTAPGLNIDSNTLYVDSAYNTVGFRLSNPNDYAFDGTPNWVASGGAGPASVIIVSGTTSTGYLAFADGTTGTDRYSGNIQYNHGNNTMSFRTNGGVEAMTINSAQDLAVDGDTLYIDASADRVGINEASPQTDLHIKNASTNSVSRIETTHTSSYAQLQLVNQSGNYWYQTLVQSDNSYRLYNGSDRLTVLSGGNVGIGTSIIPDNGTNSRVLQIKATSGAGTLHLTNDSTGTTTSDGFIISASGTDAYLINRESGAMYLRTADTNRISILSGGNVGIATDSPAVALEVNAGSDGAAAFRGRSDGGNGNNGRFNLLAYSDGGGAGYGGGIKIQTRDTVNVFHDALTIDSSQRVGIGTSSPGNTFVVNPVSTLSDGGILAEFNAISNANGLIIARYNCGSDNDRSGLYFENQGVVNSRVWVDDSMNLRIQSSNPTANDSGTVVGTQTSDARLKEVFGPVVSSLDEVLKLNPVRYALKNENRERLGFIAQEVKEVLPQTVYDTMVTHEDDDETLLAMEYVGIIPVLVNAIKELNNRIAALEAA